MLLCISYFSDLIQRFSAFISLIVNFSVFIYQNLQPFREGIHYRCANAMKTSGNLISAAAEFSPGMKNRKYNL